MAALIIPPYRVGMEALALDKKTSLALILAAVAAIAAAGCGEKDEPAETEESATPEEAIAEIQQVRRGLDDGLAAYVAGKPERADTLVGDAYLEHFELVEGPLEEVDPELNEELEELISTEIREAIKAGARRQRVQALVQEAHAGLDEAAAALGSQ
jgi:entry exclusion lipoprotein TrbK